MVRSAVLGEGSQIYEGRGSWESVNVRGTAAVGVGSKF